MNSPALLRVKENFHLQRELRRQASAVSSGTIPALRAVVRSAAEELRARLERERTNDLSESVIVLDDDARQRNLIAATLRLALGIPVYTAATVGEARSLWYDHLSAVVVVDLCLDHDVKGPVEMGDQFIRSIDHGVRAVLYSGGTDTVSLHTAAGKCNATPLRRMSDDPRNDFGKRLVSTVRDLLAVVHPPLWCRASPDAILSVSADLARLFGYTPQEMVDVGWRNLIHPDDVSDDASRTRRYTDGVEGHVQRMRKKDGTYLAIAWDVAPITDGVIYAVGHVV